MIELISLTYLLLNNVANENTIVKVVGFVVGFVAFIVYHRETTT